MKIANVHVRYEDNSKPDRSFAFGITLNDFEIFTTDKNWQKCFVDGVIRHVFKLATLDCLSVYMNCNADTYATRSGNDIIQLFRNNIASKTRNPTQYSFCKLDILCRISPKVESNNYYNYNFSIRTDFIRCEIITKL